MKQLITGGIGKTIAITSNKTFFPYIPELKDKTIKYIDVIYGCNDTKGNYIGADPFLYDVSFVRKGTNDIFIDRLSADSFSPDARLGQRLYIGEKIDFEQSYITTASQVGENAFIVFYYQDSAAGYEESSSPLKIEPNRAICDNYINYFADSRVLVNKKFSGIYPSYVERDSNGLPNVFNQHDYDCYLNLVKGSDIFLKNVPVHCMSRYNSWIGFLEFADVVLDFTNSWIEVSPFFLSNAKGMSLVMSFDYK